MNLKTAVFRIKRPFVLLELLIALFLVGMCALPLANLPFKALQEEMHSAYRGQATRLADLGFAKLKESLYKNEISWNEIAKVEKGPIVLFEEVCDLSFSPLKTKKFVRKVSLKQVGKKTQGVEQWRLFIAKIEISPQEKKMRLFQKGSKGKNMARFAYYLIVHTSNNTHEALPN